MASAIKEFDKILDQNPDIERYFKDIYNESANWKIDARLDFEAVRNAKKKESWHPAKEIAAINAGGVCVGTAALLIGNTLINMITSENLTQDIGTAVKYGAAIGGTLTLILTVAALFSGADLTPRKKAAIKELKQRAEDHHFA